jgi:polyphosphate kinase 2
MAKNSKKNDDKKDEEKETTLLEGTAISNSGAKKEEGRIAVWVKESDLAYEAELKNLQIELMKMLLDMQRSGERILAIFEGRDAAGKGGTIQRIISNLNPRNTRVVALSKPNETEQSQWYFQRYITRLPSAGEFVLFDRSWYNRAMVEPVMGFCTDEQNKRFLKDVPMVEELLVKDGIKLFKFYFSVSREVQNERFESRKTDPLKQYKLSPVDNLAQDYWDQYSVRKFQMLSETNRSVSPWTIVRSDNKKIARINCIKFILSSMNYSGKIAEKYLTPDPKIIVSGIDELRDMEKNLLTPNKLHG